MVSWNLGKLAVSGVAELVQLLGNRYGSGFIDALQEVESWPDGEKISLQGWEIFHAAGDYCAILVPLSLTHLIGSRFFSSRHACGLVIRNAGVCSCYLPDISKGNDEFACGIEELETIRQNCMLSKSKSFFLLEV